MLRKLLLTISTMLVVILGGFAVSQSSITNAQPFATGTWSATYYSDTNFTNIVQSGVTYSTLNLNFSGAPTTSTNAPIAGMPADNWSAVFTKSVTFSAGNYTYTMTADDEAVFSVVSGTVTSPIITDNQPGAQTLSETFQITSPGTYTLRVNFKEYEQQALLQLVEPTTGAPGGPGAPFFTPTPTPLPTNTALPPIPPGAITATVIRASVLNIRNAPSLGGQRIGQILRGQTYAIVGRDEDARWFLIQLAGYQGWAYGYYLFVDGNEFTPPIVSGNTVIGLAGQEDYGVRGQTDAILRLRAAPNVNAMQTGRITWGAFLPVTGRTSDGYWYQVIWKNTVGWTYAPFVNIVEGDINNVPFK